MRLVRWGFQNHQDLTKSGEKSEKSVDETVLNAIFPHPSIISVWIFLTEKTKKTQSLSRKMRLSGYGVLSFFIQLEKSFYRLGLPL